MIKKVFSQNLFPLTVSSDLICTQASAPEDRLTHKWVYSNVKVLYWSELKSVKNILMWPHKRAHTEINNNFTLRAQSLHLSVAVI